MLKKTAGILSIILLLLIPIFMDNYYVLHILITIGLYILLASSLNLVTGFVGQLTLGHVAFYGIGAYTYSLLVLRLGLNFPVSVVLSALISALFGFLLGLPTLRLQGDYLAIVTLGFAEIIRLLQINLISFTRGPMGISGIPPPKLFGYVFNGKQPFYYMILAVVLFTLFFLRRLTNSGMGFAFQTVKYNEIVAQSIGINSTKYKLLAFIIAAFFAGIAGSFYAGYISYISPDTFVYNDSSTILAMVVLGGLGSIPGSVIGVVVLILLPELLRFLSNYRMLIFGILMVFMMIFRPAGFWGEDRRVLNLYKKQLDKAK
jgi:branched-chain amino acid transport system permease protein